MATIEEMTDVFGVTLRRWLSDSFSSTETIDTAINQTASVTPYLGEMALATGVQQASEAHMRYNSPFFNLRYGTLIVKAQFDSIRNVFAFIGVKETTDLPTPDMTESHAGLMIDSGEVYFSTGNGDTLNPNQQKVAITGFDPTNNILYKFVNNTLYYWPLPIIYPYFDGFRKETPARDWSMGQQNAVYPPKNTDHYFMAYITNTTGSDKRVKIYKIVYGEKYAD